MSPGYRALHETAAYLDLSARGKIRAMGEDRVRLLHAMTTNHIEAMKPASEGAGQGCYVFFLNPQGRILGDANVFRLEDHLLLDTEPETRQKLYEHLDRYIIADDVTLEDHTDETRTIAVEGPEAAAVLARMGAPLPGAPYGWTRWGDRTVARVSFTGSDGFFIFTPAAERGALDQALAAAGAIAATEEDARTVRIEYGRPRYGEEISERYLVQETGQMHAVHFSKGCYLGQEIVERVRSRAQIHRILRRLEIDTAEVPEARAKLQAGGTDAAEIASAAFSPVLGKVVALAYVRTQFAETGTQLSLGDVPARVTSAP